MGIENSNTEEIPYWLCALLTEKFFNACAIHEGYRKNEKNVFCLDCSEGICPHCSPSHRSHRLLQIRRYVYHDVIRLADAGKLMDCSQVQGYTTNSAKVVFLNQRPLSRPPKGSSALCATCGRNLQEASLFCSICCKVEHIVKQGGNVWDYLRECGFQALSPVDEGQMTPDSVLEAESGSSTEYTNVSCSTATSEVARAKKKRSSSLRLSTTGLTAPISRRKSTPQRSPFC